VAHELFLDQDEDRAVTMGWLDCARSWRRLKRSETFKKGSRVLCQGDQVKYAVMGANWEEFSVARMCRVLQFSRSGYYDWAGREESEPSQQDRLLLKVIRKIHQDTQEAYGPTKT